LVLLLWRALPAHAHSSSITQSTVDVSEDRTSVAYRLEIEPPDTAELLGLAPDTDPTDEQVQAGRAHMLERVLSHIEVRDGETPCPPEPGDVAVANAGSRLVVLTWQARCPAPMSRLVIVYSLFSEIDPQFRTLMRARHGGEEATASLGATGNRFTWDLGAPPPSGFVDFAGSGVEHILFGFDHVAFLLTLLLTLVIWRADGVAWERRRLRHALRDTAVLVTAFTVAHSTTLISASLGWISAPGTLVESIIALSIIFVALENVIRPDSSGYRLLVAFGFGLVHGLGFASMLAALLPPEGVIVPLLAFNVGVELGQLGIVIVILPLLHGLVRLIGAPAYRKWFISIGSAILALLGALWLIERAFGIELLGF
jgi:HupE / UreJ protein